MEDMLVGKDSVRDVRLRPGHASRRLSSYNSEILHISATLKYTQNFNLILKINK